MLDRFDEGSAHIYELIRRHQKEVDQTDPGRLVHVWTSHVTREVVQSFPVPTDENFDADGESRAIEEETGEPVGHTVISAEQVQELPGQPS